MFIDKDYVSAMDEINKKILEEPVSLDTPINEIKGYLIDCSELITEDDDISPKTNQIILSLFKEQELKELKNEELEEEIEEEEEDEDIQENQKFVAEEEEIDEEEEIEEEIKLIKEKKVEKPEKRADEKKKEGKKKSEEVETKFKVQPEPEVPQKRKRGRPKRIDTTPSVESAEVERGIPEIEEKPVVKKTSTEITKSLEEQKAFIKEKFPELNNSFDASVSELEETVENFVVEFKEAILFIKDNMFCEIYKNINQIKELKAKSLSKYEKPAKKHIYKKKMPKKGKRGVGEYLESILDEGPLNVEKVADTLLDKFNYETSEIAREAIRRHIWRLKNEGIKISYDNHTGEYTIEN